MPYASNADLPAAVKSAYSDRCQTVFRNAFNGAQGDDATRFKIAHTAAGNCANATKSDDAQPETKAFQPVDMTLTEEGAVRVAFARLNVIDHDGDVTYPGAIATKAVPMSSFEHRSWPHKGGFLPVGKGEVREQGDLAIFDGAFFVDTTHGRDTYLTVKHMGDLQEWSYGFTTIDSVPTPMVNGTKARRGLKALDVHEISPVLKGAGESRTVGIKSAAWDDDDGLPAGASFAEQFGGWLAEAEAITLRTRELVGLRTKEGRKISTARRERLTTQLATLHAIASDIEALLRETDPPERDTEGKARAMRLMGRLEVARREAMALTR